MLLAADDGTSVGILLSKDKPGSNVFTEGIEKRPAREIDIKDFTKLDMKSRNGRIFYKDKVLKTKAGEICADKRVEGKVR